MKKMIFNPDWKYDIQLEHALDREHVLYEEFTGKKIELKSETWQWERTGNIAIEYRCNGRPSGIATTEAEYWIHELRRDGQTLVWLMFPIDRIKHLGRRAYKEGRIDRKSGDGGRAEIVKLPLRHIFR